MRTLFRIVVAHALLSTAVVAVAPLAAADTGCSAGVFQPNYVVAGGCFIGNNGAWAAVDYHDQNGSWCFVTGSNLYGNQGLRGC